MTDRTLAAMVRDRAGKDWCLFLDRDGVINRRIIDGYVRNWAEFEFEPGVLEALATLARWAPRIIVVTNQQGVGKGLMTMSDLAHIHGRMRAAVATASGRIDAVQFCPDLVADACDCRKPSPGMAIRYLDAHPEADGSLSVMIGDTDSDIEMGRRLAAVTGGTFTVRIDGRQDPHADTTYPTLSDFATAIKAVRIGTAHTAGHSAE